jgi:hypothetical protein
MPSYHGAAAGGGHDNDGSHSAQLSPSSSGAHKTALMVQIITINLLLVLCLLLTAYPLHPFTIFADLYNANGPIGNSRNYAAMAWNATAVGGAGFNAPVTDAIGP